MAGAVGRGSALQMITSDRVKLMELISSNERRVSIEELDTTKILSHARSQAVQRKLDDMLIVDVDSHHYGASTTASSCSSWKTRCCAISPRAVAGGQGTAWCRARSATRTWAGGSRAIRYA